MQNRYHQLTVIILIALFTILQLVILLAFGYTPYPDSDGYIQIAQECILYGEPYPIVSELYEYPFLWNIGAINAVVASLALFHSVFPLFIVYSLMKGATAWMFYGITKKIANEHIALIALILYVIYPANYGESTSTHSELPFIFFVFTGIFLTIVRNWSFAGGMMLAIANWVRPMGIVFLLALLIFFLFKWRKSTKLITGYTVMILIIGSMSYQRTGLFLYQAKTGWMALIEYSSDHSPESMKVHERTDWNVSQKDSAWQALFIDWVKDHPKEYVSQMPQKLINTYVSDNVNMCTFIPNKTEAEYMYEEVSMLTLIKNFPNYSAVQCLTLLNLIFYYTLIICAVLSLSYYRQRTYLLPVSIITIGTLLLLIVGHGEARFHIPFMPFVILMASQLIGNKYGKNRVD